MMLDDFDRTLSIEEHFVVFEKYLDETASTENATDGKTPAEKKAANYQEICRQCRIPPDKIDDLDRYIFETFGISGDDMVRSYLTHTPLPLL